MSEETIWIVTEVGEQESDGGKGGPYRRTQSDAVTTSTRVSVATLEAKMTQFLNAIGRLFQKAQTTAMPQTGLTLDEIELSVEITAEGEVKLMGTGGKAGSKGAITLKFKRPS